MPRPDVFTRITPSQGDAQVSLVTGENEAVTGQVDMIVVQLGVVHDNILMQGKLQLVVM